MAGIRINSLSRRVLLYGQSMSPRRSHGIFSIAADGSEFRDLRIFEGHVNTAGPPQRLLAITCTPDNWDLDRAIERHGPGPLRIWNDDTSYEFVIRRSRPELIALMTAGGPTGKLSGNGRLSCSNKHISVTAFKSEHSNLIHLDGDREQLRDAFAHFLQGCECILFMGGEGE